MTGRRPLPHTPYRLARIPLQSGSRTLIKTEVVERREREREETIEREKACRQAIEFIVSSVERQEGRQKKWTKEYRKGYERLYRKKKQLQRHMELSLHEKMLSIRKEVLKRRLAMESEVADQIWRREERAGSVSGDSFRRRSGNSTCQDPLLSRSTRVKSDSVSSIGFLGFPWLFFEWKCKWTA